MAGKKRKASAQSGRRIKSTPSSQVATSPCFLSRLPVEVLMHILDMVIEEPKDAERLALVCYGFYTLAIDRRGWKAIDFSKHVESQPTSLHRLMSFYATIRGRESRLVLPLKHTTSLMLDHGYDDDDDGVPTALINLVTDTALFDDGNWRIQHVDTYELSQRLCEDLLPLLKKTLRRLTVCRGHATDIPDLNGLRALEEICITACDECCCDDNGDECLNNCFWRGWSSCCRCHHEHTWDEDGPPCELTISWLKAALAQRAKRDKSEPGWKRKLLTGADGTVNALGEASHYKSIKKLELSGSPLSLFRSNRLIGRGSFEDLEHLDIRVENFIEGLTLAILSCRWRLQALRIESEMDGCMRDAYRHILAEGDHAAHCGSHCAYAGFADMCGKLAGGRMVALRIFEPSLPQSFRKVGAESFFDLIEQTPTITNFTVVDRKSRKWDYESRICPPANHL